MHRRLDNTLSSVTVLLLAVTVAYISYTQEPAEAFLFPRVISTFFVALALINLAFTLFQQNADAITFEVAKMKNILAGLVIIFVLVFFAAKALGFYLSSSVAFFFIYSLYDHHPHDRLFIWGKRVLITVIFMGIIYGLFALLLQVQTPRGIAL